MRRDSTFPSSNCSFELRAGPKRRTPQAGERPHSGLHVAFPAVSSHSRGIDRKGERGVNAPTDSCKTEQRATFSDERINRADHISAVKQVELKGDFPKENPSKWAEKIKLPKGNRLRKGGTQPLPTQRGKNKTGAHHRAERQNKRGRNGGATKGPSFPSYITTLPSIMYSRSGADNRRGLHPSLLKSGMRSTLLGLTGVLASPIDRWETGVFNIIGVSR